MKKLENKEDVKKTTIKYLDSLTKDEIESTVSV
jgi:hypothetical protein